MRPFARHPRHRRHAAPAVAVHLVGLTIDPTNPRLSMFMIWDLKPWAIQAGSSFWPQTLLDDMPRPRGVSVFEPAYSTIADMHERLADAGRYWGALHGQ